MSVAEIAPARRLPAWAAQLFGTLLAAGAVWWMLRGDGTQSVWQSIRGFDAATFAVATPLVLVNLGLRALRWRVLLRGGASMPLARVFSALSIGYLANNVLPARGGDLVRVWTLANASGAGKSRVLATVVVERILDTVVIIVMIGLAASLSAVPPWMQRAGLALAGTAAAGLLAAVVLGAAGPRWLPVLLRPFHRFAPAMVRKVESVVAEFIDGLVSFRRPGIAFAFFALSAVIWALEIGTALVVSGGLGLGIRVEDAWRLILFAALASFIPALPGQLGSFEAAVVSGAELLGIGSAAALPFALAWHLVLLGGTSAIGAVCLVVSGGSLVPQRCAGDGQ